MGYKVFISSGSGKNRATMGSIELPTKQRVAEYVKRNPLGTYKTKVRVTDTSSGKVHVARKLTFQNPTRW